MQKLEQIHVACWIFTIALMLGLTLPILIQDGMFNDAILYTSVSKNLANGLGTFWHPYFDPHNVIGISSFHEQPPLAFGIESIFFKVLGNGMYTERVYVLCTLFINAGLIKILWNEIFKGKKLYQLYGWLPVLLWILIPVCFWSYSNNMHENTMSIFVLLSIIFIYKGLQSKSFTILKFIIGGIFISLAFLTKGFPSLFPLSLPFLYFIIFKKQTFAAMTFQTSILFLTIGLIACCIYLYPPSRSSLSIYLFQRAFARIHDAHTVDSRFFIVFRLMSELIPQFIFTTIFLFIAKIKKVSFVSSDDKRNIIFFFAIAISGTIPLMLTKVQNGFYMVAALPYFGIAFALLNIKTISILFQKIEDNFALIKKLSFASIAILIGVFLFSFSKIGGATRDKTLLHDVYIIGKTIPAFSSCQCSNSEIYTNNEFQCYLVRYFNISYNMQDTNKYIISLKDEKMEFNYDVEKYNIGLENFDLYRRK